MLSPINPFSKRQEQIVHLRANGFTYPGIAHNLGISFNTVKNHISGEPYVSGKAGLGILGTIEKASGERPGSHNWVTPLFGDVIFFEDEMPKGEFVTKGNTKLVLTTLDV